MGEEVTVEGRVLLQESLEVQRPLRGHELIKAHLVRRYRGPLPLRVPVIRIRPDVADALENHADTLATRVARTRTRQRYDLAAALRSTAKDRVAAGLCSSEGPETTRPVEILLGCSTGLGGLGL
jgi:hypothetical protein